MTPWEQLLSRTYAVYEHVVHEYVVYAHAVRAVVKTHHMREAVQV
jgi:hypothetical protein